MSTYLKRCEEVNSLFNEIEFLENEHRLRLTPTLWDRTYLQEAVKAFCNELFVSSVIVASALIESCLYWEWIRTDPKFKIAETVLPQKTLNPLFRKFYGTDIPVKLLVESEEPVEWLFKTKKVSEIKFIRVRNKFSHCDIKNLSMFLPFQQSFYDSLDEEYSELEIVAYVHLLKTLRFMKDFTQIIIKKYLNPNR